MPNRPAPRLLRLALWPLRALAYLPMLALAGLLLTDSERGEPCEPLYYD